MAVPRNDSWWLEHAAPGTEHLWDPPTPNIPLLTFAHEAQSPDAPLPPSARTTAPDAVGGEESEGLKWAPGALAGVLGHHASPPETPQPPFIALIDLIEGVAAGSLRREEVMASYEALLPVQTATARQVTLALNARPRPATDDEATRRTLAAALVCGWLIARGTDPGPVKAGMAAATLLDWGAVVEPASHLGRLTEFSSEACSLIRRYPSAEQQLFQLAQWHRGWGRVHAVEALGSLDQRDPAVDRWLALEGWSNQVHDAYTASVVAERVDLANVLWLREGDGTVSHRSLAAARGLASALLDPYSPGAHIAAFPAMAGVIRDWFLGHQQGHRDWGMADLAFTRELWVTIEQNPDDLGPAFTDEMLTHLAVQCRALLSHEHSRRLVEQVLVDPSHRDAVTATELAPLYGIDAFPVLAGLVWRNPDDLSAWVALCRDHARVHGPEIIELALQSLPVPLTGEPLVLNVGRGPIVHGAVTFLWQWVIRPGHDAGRGWLIVERLLRSPERAARMRGLELFSSLAPDRVPATAGALLHDVASREPDAQLRSHLAAAADRVPLQVTAPQVTAPQVTPPLPSEPDRVTPPAQGPSPSRGQSDHDPVEHTVAVARGVLRWKGERMGLTILNAKPGDLILTTTSLRFQPYDGSVGLDIRRGQITGCEAGKKRALVVRYTDARGSASASAFGQQMGMPNLAAWVEALQPGGQGDA